MYLAPRNPTALGVISVYNNIERSMEPNLSAALQLLEEHAAKIDTAKVCYHDTNVTSLMIG